jgi:hypothetical protein
MKLLTLSLRRLAPLVLLSTSALPCHAGDAEAVRSANRVGPWIAAQGNAALQQLNRELKAQLSDRIQPLLPAQDVVVAGDPRTAEDQGKL